MAKKNESLIAIYFESHPSGSGDPMVRIDVPNHEPAYFGRTDFENTAMFIKGHIERLHDEELVKEREAQEAAAAQAVAEGEGLPPASDEGKGGEPTP